MALSKNFYRQPKKESKNDSVNSPDHYAAGEIECIDAMIEVFGIEKVQTWAEVSGFKYQWRKYKKGKPDEDHDKAIWCMRFAKGDDPRRTDGQQ